MGNININIDVPNSTVALIQATNHLSENVGLRMDTKNDTCLNKIGLNAQNMLIILRSLVNTIEGIYMSTGIFTLTMSDIFLRTP